MELQTISQVSRQYGISTRTLRYYEQIGLIQPVKKEDFAYRTYDAHTIVRLQQIIVLRKLRIPLKQISDILKGEDTAAAINAFNQNLAEIDDEIAALSTIKDVIQTLLERLRLKTETLKLLDDENLLEIIDSLTISKINFKEAKAMNELNKAIERIERYDIRFVFLKPTRVLSAFIKNTDRTRSEEDDVIYHKEWLRITDGGLKLYPGEGFEVTSSKCTHMLCMRKIPDDCINDTIYEDFILEGIFIAAANQPPEYDTDPSKYIMQWLEKSEDFELDAVSTGGDRCEVYWTGLSSTSGTAGETNVIKGSNTIQDDYRKLIGKEDTEPHQWECYVPIRAKKKK